MASHRAFNVAAGLSNGARLLSSLPPIRPYPAAPRGWHSGARRKWRCRSFRAVKLAGASRTALFLPDRRLLSPKWCPGTGGLFLQVVPVLDDLSVVEAKDVEADLGPKK